jgi:hypothetical protein
VGCNQPPHVGFYLGDGMTEPPRPQIKLLYGDSAGDNIADTNDLSKFPDFWLVADRNETAELGVKGDCIIDFHEFSSLARNRLEGIR